MVILKKSIPRRTFLRGAGASLALPVLDAMSAAFAAQPARPIRLAFIEVPNGIMMDKWTPATEGAGFALTPILEPLAQFPALLRPVGILSATGEPFRGFFHTPYRRG